MNSGIMKIHAFEVNHSNNATPLEEIIFEVNNKPLEDRNRKMSKKVVRLEACKEKNGLLLVDIAKFRDGNGPGKANEYTPTEGIPMEDGDDFSELTAALYNPQKKCIIVQYNHNGVRGGSMGTYFSKVSKPSKYKFKVILDPKVIAKYRRINHTHKIKVGIAASKITVSDNKQGVSLQAAIKAREETGADFISMTISWDSSKKKDLGKAMDLVKRLIGKKEPVLNDDEIKSLHVTGKADMDATTEVLDLLNHRLVEEVEISSDKSRRFPRNERWDRLMEVHNKWKNLW